VRRAAIIAAYAAAELHLLASDVRSSDGTASSSTSSSFLGGGGHRATWTFLEARSAEAARLIVATSGPLSSSFGGIAFPSPSSSSYPFPLAAAAASSLAGAALSLASPSAAQAMAGTALPRAMDSALGLLQSFVGISTRTNAPAAFDGGRGGRRGDGTRPGDYDAMETISTLPPFDSSEEIFPGGNGRGRSVVPISVK
jgi:hypothetical protein